MDNYANFSGSFGAHWHYHVVESLNSQNAGANQSSIHLTGTLANDSGYSMSSSGSWSLRLNGSDVADDSGSINQGPTGANNAIIVVDVTVTHDTNGNWSGSCGGSAAFAYSGVGSASGDWGFSLPRIALAPTISSTTADQITAVAARLGTEISSNGHGTSAERRLYWGVHGSGIYSNTSDQGDDGSNNYATITGLTPGISYDYYSLWYNNNGDTVTSSVQTFSTKNVPGMVPILLAL